MSAKSLIGAAFIVVAIAIYGLYTTSQRCLVAVTVDQGSESGKHFVETSGFPMLRVELLRGNRQHVDYVTFVGKNREFQWFKNLGFKPQATFIKEPEESATLVQEIPGAYPFLSHRDKNDRTAVINMDHPHKQKTQFYYLPRIGMLSYHAEEESSPE